MRQEKDITNQHPRLLLLFSATFFFLLCMGAWNLNLIGVTKYQEAKKQASRLPKPERSVTETLYQALNQAAKKDAFSVAETAAVRTVPSVLDQTVENEVHPETVDHHVPAVKNPTWIVFLRIQKTASTYYSRSVQIHSHGCDCSWTHCQCQTQSSNDLHGKPCSQMDCIQTTCERLACRHMWENPPHADWLDLGSAFARANISSSSVVFMTVLRQPVDRVMSEYRFLSGRDDYKKRCKNGLQYAWDYQVPCNQTLEDYLNYSIDASQRFNNRQTHMIAGLGDASIEQRYGTPDKMLEQAKNHLQQMPWFGITERTDESLWLLQHVVAPQLGIDLSVTPTKDRNVSKRKRETKDDKWKARIERENRVDVLLYDYAVELFDKRLEEAREQHKA